MGRLAEIYQSLALDNTHAATLIHYQKIEYSFHNLFLLFILIVQHIYKQEELFPASIYPLKERIEGKIKKRHKKVCLYRYFL